MKTKRPLPGALVSITQPDTVAVHPAPVVADSEGFFRLTEVPPGTYDVMAQFDVKATESVRFSFSGRVGPVEIKDDADIIIPVDVRGALVGRVLDANEGTPVRGALVRFLEDTGGQIMAATQEDGWYSLGFINPGTFTLTCESPGYEKYAQKVFIADSSERITDLTIFLARLPSPRLPETGVVRGLVLNEAGNPAVGAEVSLIGNGVSRGYVVTRNYFDYQLGHYEFRDVPESTYRIVAIKPGMQPAEVKVKVSRGKDNWAPDLRLKSLPHVAPAEVECLAIEPPSIIQGQSIRFVVRLAEPLRRSTFISTQIWGPGGWNMGFGFDNQEPDGTWTKTFPHWRVPGLFVLRQLFLQNRETGKGFELPVQAQFEVVPDEPPPLSPDSPLFKTPR